MPGREKSAILALMFLASGHAAKPFLLFERHFVVALGRPSDLKLLRFKSLISCVTLLSLLLISGMTAAADKLSLLYSAQSVSYSMPWIAQDAGLFRKHDLDVKLVYIPSSGVAHRGSPRW
jgi:hypothetical protein